MKVFSRLRRLLALINKKAGNSWNLLTAIVRKLRVRVTNLISSVKNSFIWEMITKIVAAFFKTLVNVSIFLSLVLIMIWVNEKIQKPTTAQDQSILFSFILEWQSLIYTLIVGGIIAKTWTKNERLNSEITREANALILLIQASKMCGDKNQSAKLVSAIQNYVIHVQNLKTKDKRTTPQSVEKIEKILDCVKNIINDSNVPEFLKTEIMHHYYEVYTARNNRFELIDQKIPLRIWVLFVTISLSWLWGFFWLEISSASLAGYLAGISVFITTFFYFLARDLDDPTTGFWIMSFEDFNRIKFKLTK